jgi:hypothetical protein
MNDGFVYCAVNDENRLCKIGYSKDVNKRIAQLNCGSLIKLTLAVHVPANRAIESAFHYRLRKFKYETHSAREYFQVTPESVKIIKHHMRVGFSETYVKRVKWRSEYRAAKYRAKIQARKPSKQPELSHVGWIVEAGKLFSQNETVVNEFNRISPHILPSYPRALYSIAEQVTRRIISKAQAKYAEGIVQAYINAYRRAKNYYSGVFLLEVAGKQCYVCKRNTCQCKMNLTHRDLSSTLYDVYGDEYALRHGYVKPSKKADEFAEKLNEIAFRNGLSREETIDLTQAWRVA